MKNVIEILERYYKPFIDEKNEWNFFLGLADYVKFIAENKEFTPILLNIKKQKEKDYKKLVDLEKRVAKELDISKKRLLEIIKKNKISYESLNNELRKLKTFEEGGTEGEKYKVMILDDILFSIARDMVNNGHSKILQEFVDNNREPQNIFGNFVFSKTIHLFVREQERVDFKKKTEAWGIWDKLYELYLVTYKGDEIEKDFEKNKSSSLLITSFWLLKGELLNMQKGQDTKYKIFDIDEYRQSSNRIHNFFLKEIYGTSNDEEETNVLSFQGGILNFQGKKISISQRGKTARPYDLLELIFTDKDKVWNYDEIWDTLLGNEYDPKKWRTIYYAGRKINEAVAKKTTVDDFLEITKKIIQIKNQYL